MKFQVPGKIRPEPEWAIRERYLWIPKNINGEIRWLEHAKWTERIHGVSMMGEPAHEPWKYIAIGWGDCRPENPNPEN